MKKNFQFSIFNFQRGFTVIEMLIAIVILGICVTIVSLSFSKINSGKALEKSVDVVVSVLNEARSLTLSAKNGYQYGVNLQATQVVLFRGATYSASTSTNVFVPLNTLVGIRNITLVGGGSSVVFDRLTGQTTKMGTLELYLKASTTNFRTVTITSTGAIEEN